MPVPLPQGMTREQFTDPYGSIVSSLALPRAADIFLRVIASMLPDPHVPYAFGRIGVMPGREKIASDIIKRGLKEPWFHGTPFSDVLLEGISPKESFLTPGKIYPGRAPGFLGEKVGATGGLRLGEPAGVSLTRSPQVARTFGDVLRVGVDIPPSSVGQFVDPEMQRLLRNAYYGAKENWAAKTTGQLPNEQIAWFNQVMSDYLRAHGIEGLAYSPRRYGEFELRVLDPSKAVPLGKMPTDILEDPRIMRYLYGSGIVGESPEAKARRLLSFGGLRKKLEQLYKESPEYPSRLSHILKDVLTE